MQSLPDAERSAINDQLLVHRAGENRLATVLFVDMASSVQTTHGLNAETAAELVNHLLAAMVQSLKRYDGRIDRFLGDGALAVFGTPRAHENDPERAIRAAIDIRDAAQELGHEVTAGINTGEVFFTDMGSDQHRELTVMGPVVNLAARLQGSAQAGQILTGEATYRHTHRMFRFDTLDIDIKGIDDPVTAHRVVETLPRPERVRGIDGLHAELIGRDRDLDDLRATLTKALHGDGQIVTVIGEAGVGKSRLIEELRRVAMAPPPGQPIPLWIEGRCVELGETVSYGPFIDGFHDYFGSHADDHESVRADAIASALQQLVASGNLTRQQMDEMGPLLGHIRSTKFGNDWDDRLTGVDPAQIRDRTFHAVRDFLCAMSQQCPVVLLLDDLHWADSLSIDLISLLMESLATAPILLLCVYRPETEHRCWRLGTIAERKCLERFHEIRLRELTRTDSGALVDALLDVADLPTSLREMVLAKAHGNPFFVEEIVRSLIASGAVYHDDTEWKACEEIDSFTVPENVQGVVLSRVDRLGADLRYVLQSASVIGRVFRQSVLERVATQASDIAQALWELEGHALIYQGRTVPEPEYVFRHALTQDAVYQTVARRRRAEFHGDVAREMESLYAHAIDEHVEHIAYHYVQSGDADKAIEYLGQAGARALSRSAMIEADAHFTEGLNLIPSVEGDRERAEQELALTMGLGSVLGATEGYASPRVSSYTDRARELAGQLNQPIALGTALLGSAVVAMVRGQFVEANEYGVQLLHIAGTSGPISALAAAHLVLGMTKSHFGRLRQACEHLEACADLIDTEPPDSVIFQYGQHPRVVALAYMAFVKSYRGMLDQGAAAHEQSIAYARTLDHPFTMALALGFGAALGHTLHGTPNALALADELLDLTAEHDFPFWRAHGLTAKGRALVEQGTIERGMDLLHEGYEGLDQGDGGSNGRLELIEGHLLTGDLDTGLAFAQEVRSSLAEIGGHGADGLAGIVATRAALLQGALFAAKGEHDDALRCLDDVIMSSRAQENLLLQLLATVGVARIRQAQGRHTEALATLEPVYAEFTEGLDLRPLSEARSLIEELSGQIEADASRR